ncbi:MAG: DUF4145 domain-containing protein [Candidatus Cohnella colombiensis]|uniref:DUF4145 domain-containing protein n=1 Tax=Candidatus Cohnella colombiensis TaxID=3121368 RepID=A0AA95EUR0_9BACL|nr:MAG: DUF4145 domain-containing protein [Cohnella sp.]
MSINFAFLQGIDDKIYSMSVIAEKLSKTQPNQCAVELRRTMEEFMKALCRKHNLDNTDLKRMAIAVQDAGLINEDQANQFKRIRLLGNDYTHPNKEISVKDAVERTRDLHMALATFYRDQKLVAAPIAPFHTDFIPMNEYKPVQVLNKDSNEACEKKYLCTYVSTYGEEHYCVIRQFNHKRNPEDQAFLIRDLYALEKRWSSGKFPNNIVKYHRVSIQENNDLFFTCYDFSKKARLLQDVNVRALNKREKLELVRGIANGIHELHQGKEPIYHRFLSPSSIYVIRESDGELDVKIGEFEYAKVNNPNKVTMLKKVLDREDLYKAPELEIEDVEVNWAAVDIYAFGVTVLHIFLAEQAMSKRVALLEKQGCSAAFTQVVARMIHPNAASRPDIETIRSVLEEEGIANV